MDNEDAYQFAGFWWRVLAYTVDAAILWAGMAAVSLAMLPWRRAPADVWLSVAQTLVAWLYFALFECSPAMATPGKRACGLIVVSEGGERVSFGQALGRQIGKLASALLFGVGFVMIAWTRHKQALHDKLAECLVLKRVPGVTLAGIAPRHY